MHGARSYFTIAGSSCRQTAPPRSRRCQPSTVRIADHDRDVRLLNYKTTQLSQSILEVKGLNVLATQNPSDRAVARHDAFKYQRRCQKACGAIATCERGKHAQKHCGFQEPKHASSEEASLGSGITLLPMLLHSPG